MIKKSSIFIIVTLFCFLFASLVFSGAATYVGLKKCKMCHSKQNKVWEGTMHAKAMDSLKTEAEKKDASCLKCHQTIAEHACEACHGAGSEHVASKDKKSTHCGLDPKVQCVTCHDQAKTKDVKQMKPQKFDYATSFKKIEHPK